MIKSCQIKWLMLVILSTTLVACFGGNTHDAPKPPEKQPENKSAQKAPTVDYRKAALLNVEMGQAYLAQGQVARAKQKFMHALELQPKLAEVHTSVGYFYETVGDIAEAENHYKEAISLGERKGRFFNNYGTFLCRQERYKEADRAFNSAIKDKQYIKTAEAYENAGICALKQPNVSKAYDYLKTAVRRDPQRYMAHLELANMELDKQNYAAAKDYLDRYTTLVGANSRSLWLNVQVNNKLGNKNEASSAVMQLKNMYPQSAEYKLYLESTNNG